jgi:hypothetical protein
MDATIQSIRSRFDQKDFKVYENIQERFFWSHLRANHAIKS